MSYRSETIATAITRMNRQYFLPAIQREFVWKPEQIAQLFDSIMRGYRNYINLLLAGSSINNLRPSSIDSLEFLFPERTEQVAIADALAEMGTEIAALEARRDKFRLLKQGMMQELLTGRTRLVKPEAVPC